MISFTRHLATIDNNKVLTECAMNIIQLKKTNNNNNRSKSRKKQSCTSVMLSPGLNVTAEVCR